GKSTLLDFIRFTLFGYPRLIEKRRPPLRGGDHGGRILTTLSSSRDVTFGRSGSNDRMTFSDTGHLPVNEADWYRSLGQATRELYHNVYAFSLDELVGLENLTASGVEDKIFSVGMGLGNISLGETEKAIRTNNEAIYKSRGSVNQVAKILQDMKEVHSTIAKIQGNLPRYKILMEEIEALKSEAVQGEQELEKRRIEKTRLENFLKCYDSFVACSRADEKIQSIPKVPDCPPGGMEKLIRLETKERELNEQAHALEKGAHGETGTIDLEKKLEGITYNKNLLAQNGKTDFLEKNLERYKASKSDLVEEEQQIKAYEEQIKKGINRISGQWSEEKVLSFTDSMVHLDRLVQMKASLVKMEEDRRTREARESVITTPSATFDIQKLAIILSTIFIIISAPAFYAGNHVLGIALVLIAAVLFFGKRFLLIHEKEPAGSPGEKTRENEREEELLHTCKIYLEKTLSLPGDLSIDTALEIVKSLEPLQEMISKRDRLVEKQQEIRMPFIREFEETVSAVQPLVPGITEKEVTRVAESLIKASREAQVISQQVVRVKEELDRKLKSLSHTRENIKLVQEELKDLLQSVNAEDTTAFRKLYEESNALKALKQERENAIQTIEKIAGIGMAEEVSEYLLSREKGAMESEYRQLTINIEELEKDSREKNGLLGEKRNELKSIESTSELSGELTVLETLRQQLKDAYKDWLAGNLALNLLAEVKGRYEEEKQPEVIRHSGSYFKKATSDKYSEIRVSMDDRSVTILDAHHIPKKIEQLSRGTKELLLISLRLGFIEAYEKQMEPLPVIADEVLVNFDPSRARQTAAILHEFARDRQLLMFTCHPGTKDLFEGKEVNVVKLNSGE
ncbi:MAG: AAA family ATPase, partial [Cyclobacteriaceae bacterium]|nr:AAA family ATPase [Cyclobacteriaceae bacterium]